MKSILICFEVLFITFLMNSCSYDETPVSNSEVVLNDSIPPKNDSIEHLDCAPYSVANFNEFLGLNYGDNEFLIVSKTSKLGKYSKGEVTADGTNFIYHFNRVDRVPISVWVNKVTGKINTIFMEVISLDDMFIDDLELAKQEFDIAPCEANWFGRSVAEIKSMMGEADEEGVSSEGVTLLSYDSEDLLCTVTFKFYEQQGDKCSSVSVNWFYKD